MHKTELIDSMCETGGMSRKYATTAVDAMLKTIKDALRRERNYPRFRDLYGQKQT